MRVRPVPAALAAAVVALSGCSSPPASEDEAPAPAPVTVTETVEVEVEVPATPSTPRAVPESDPQLCASMRALYTMNENEGINQAYQGSYLDLMRASNCRMP